MDGAAGSSCMNTAGWKRLCTSFHSYSTDLCDAIALLAKRLCTTYVDPNGLEAFVACRFIALDNRPSVRQITIGGVLRCITGRAISITLKSDIQDQCSKTSYVEVMMVVVKLLFLLCNICFTIHVLTR